MCQYFTKDSYSNDNNSSNNINVSATQSGFEICLPDFGKIIISIPILKNCTLNPLNDPMFVLGESWLIDLKSDGSLAVGLPVENGQRQTFLFSEKIWRNWIGSNDAQSFVESHSIDKNASINSMSLMDINASDIAKLFEDDEILATFLSMDWLSESQTNISIGTINELFGNKYEKLC